MQQRSQPGRTRPAAPPPSDPSFASAWRRAHLTVDERIARGRTARAEAPRAAHGRWEPAPDRPDPVALLEEQAASRVPELVPIRYGRMLVSPFTFYRGAALIMAADLAGPRVRGHRAAVRRRSPVQLRPVRHARAADAVRHQRLRRDPARPVGVGRQAPGGQFRDHGTRPRLHPGRPARDRHGRGQGVPGPDAPGRRDGHPGRLVRPPGGGDAAQAGPPGGPRQAGRQERGPGATRTWWPRRTPGTARGCSPSAPASSTAT